MFLLSNKKQKCFGRIKIQDLWNSLKIILTQPFRSPQLHKWAQIYPKRYLKTFKELFRFVNSKKSLEIWTNVESPPIYFHFIYDLSVIYCIHEISKCSSEADLKKTLFIFFLIMAELRDVSRMINEGVITPIYLWELEGNPTWLINFDMNLTEYCHVRVMRTPLYVTS